MRSMKDMPFHIGIKVKIYPSNEQKRLIAVNDGAKRAVYNHMVACGNERYRLSKTSCLVPSDAVRLEYLESVTASAAGIKNALPFLYGSDVDDQTIANAIRNYKAAWKNMRELHRGVPIFKKKGYEQSYQTNAHYYADKNGDMTSNVRFLDREHVTLPKLGRIRFGGSPERVSSLLSRRVDTRIGAVMISRDAVGEYWASFSIASEAPFRDPLPKTGSRHGIDLNLIELVNGSDGNAATNMRFYARSQKRLAKQQRCLSRRMEHAKAEGRSLHLSRNYQEQRRKVAYLHRKTARQREDYLHNLSKHEIENQDFIAAEDLKVRNLLKNHCLAKAVTDAGWRKLLTMLQYKADIYGKTVVLVPPQYTTQTCSSCGYVMKREEHLTLKDREWSCPQCGTFHHRDTNAAQNILLRGLQAVQQT